MKNGSLREKLNTLTSNSDDKFATLLSLLCENTDKGIDLILSSLNDDQHIQLRDKINGLYAGKSLQAPTTASTDETASYLGDDRDFDEQSTINAYWMDNGDYYLSISWREDGAMMNSPSVRFCTSGGASSEHPRLPTAVADIFHAIRYEPTSIERMEAERNEAYIVINRILEKDIGFQDVSDFMLTKFW